MSAKHKSIESLIRDTVAELKVGHAVLFLGPPGVGKTEVAQQIATQLEKDLYILNASQASKDDLTIPVIRNGKEEVELSTINLDNKILLLDEVTNASPDLMSALLSLVLSKKIGNRKFKNLSIIATGNRSTESSLANPLPRPLIERFSIENFPVPSKDEWAQYMVSYKGESYLPYILFVKEQLTPEQFIEASEFGEVEDYEPRPSPRSHSLTAEVLGHGLKSFGIERPEDVVKNEEASSFVVRRVAAHVGNAIANEFLNYLRDASDFFTLEDLNKGRIPENTTQGISLIYSAASKYRPTPDAIEKMKNESAIAEWLKETKFLEVADKIIGALEAGGVSRLSSPAIRLILGSSYDKNTAITLFRIRNKIASLVSQQGDKTPYKNIKMIIDRARQAKY